MKRTDVYLTNSQYTTIKEEAVKKEITFSELLRRIIDVYISKDLKNDRKTK